jgi:hypothetical protein
MELTAPSRVAPQGHCVVAVRLAWSVVGDTPEWGNETSTAPMVGMELLTLR